MIPPLPFPLSSSGNLLPTLPRESATSSKGMADLIPASASSAAVNAMDTPNAFF